MGILRRAALLAALSLLAGAAGARAGAGSLFLGGLSFFDAGDLDRTSEDIRAGSLSPGFDGDFLLSFRDAKRTSVLAGFGIFWSARTERDEEIPFSAPEEEARLEAFAFPFTAGFVRRPPPDRSRGWAWGALAHYYFVKMTVDADPGLGDPSGFSLDASGRGERDGGGPGISAFAAYEIPFLLGRAGAGVKARHAPVSVNGEPGLYTPDMNLSGITVFLSVALR